MRVPRAVVRLLAFVIICSVPSHASAQLISLQLLQSILDSINISSCTLPLLSKSAKVDAAVQQWARLGGQGTIRIIVSAQGGLLGTVKTIVAALGIPLLGELVGINAIVVEANGLTLSTLACSTAVASISIDAVVSVTGEPEPAPAYSLRSTLGVPSSTPTGAGIAVAVIDSGIAASADFSNRIVSFFDFTNGAKATSPSDAYGHGTHVAGLIAGSGSLAGSADYRGVGTGALLIGMKVLDAQGSGRTSDVIRAVEYATAQRAKLGVKVINLSLGHPIYESAAKDPLVRAVDAASRAGIIVVAASGNQGFNAERGESGYGGVMSPGNAPSAITVGAVMTKDTTSRADDEVAPYSSRGPSWYDGFAKPDLVAPGHGLVSVAASNSTLYTTYPTARVGTNYLRLSGTSMATAVASGTVALLLEANKAAFPNGPPLTPNAIKAMLQYSSLQVRDGSGVAYDQLTQGAGALNAAGAIALARATNTAIPVGSTWWTTSVTPSSQIGGVDYTWSEHIVWGSHIVWGTSIATNEAEWGLNKTWGSSAVWESHIVWGTDVVWADPHSWATHIVWGTNFIGAMSDTGDHIVWGTAEEPKTTVWGNLADAGGASP